MNNDNCIHCSQCPAWKDSLFSEFSNDELNILSEKKSVIILKKNEAAFRQGEKTKGLFCIGQGGVKITQQGKTGETVVRIAPPGDSVGHRSIFIYKTYKGSALSMADSSLCFLSMELINNLLNNNTSFALKLIRKMASDMNLAEEQNIAHRQKNVRERMAQFLLDYENSFKKHDPLTASVELKLTRSEIASLIGSAEDTVIRLISEFKENGWIEENGKTLVIRDRTMLKKLSAS